MTKIDLMTKTYFWGGSFGLATVEDVNEASVEFVDADADAGSDEDFDVDVEADVSADVDADVVVVVVCVIGVGVVGFFIEPVGRLGWEGTTNLDGV